MTRILTKKKGPSQQAIIQAWSMSAIRAVYPYYKAAVQADAEGRDSAGLWAEYQAQLEKAYGLVYLLGRLWAFRMLPRPVQAAKLTGATVAKYADTVTIEAAWTSPYERALEAFRAKLPGLEAILPGLRRIAAQRAAYSTQQEKANAAQSLSRIIHGVLDPYKTDDIAAARVEALKSLLGEKAVVSRLTTEYRTTLAEAFGGGAKDQLDDTVDAIPARIYKSHRDIRTRGNPDGLYPEPDRHWQMNGFTAASTDPIWNTVKIPCGWNCRCNIIGLSWPECRRRGLVLPNGQLDTAKMFRESEEQRQLVTSGQFPDKGFPK